MKNNFDLDFGLVIAFLLPGFIFIYGLSFSYCEVKAFLEAANLKSTSIGAFFLISLASLAVGLLISAIRWMIVDTVMNLIGIGNKNLKFASLKDKDALNGYMLIVDNHYRYYQYYANSLISIIAGLVIYVPREGFPGWGPSLSVAFVLLALALGAGDACKKYHDRAAEIVGVKET